MMLNKYGTIGIRVDSNDVIATGHLMRCLSIATGLKKKGFRCLFISADYMAKETVLRNDFEFVCLDTSWNDCNSEIIKLERVIKQERISKLIVDSYYVTFDYLKYLNSLTKVVYIDDVKMFHYPVSMLLNYSIYADVFEYAVEYSNRDSRLLLGCSYVPLRDEFSRTYDVYRSKAERVLITTGGTDNYNISEKILKHVLTNQRLQHVEFHVIIGMFNRNKNDLERIAQNNNIYVYKNVNNMAELMSSCDIAISAGGFTLYELCSCGVPTITVSFADNQLLTVKTFDEKEIMPYAGDIRNSEESCIQNMIEYLLIFLSNGKMRKLISEKMSKVVDGKGVERISEEISKL